eukprot:2965768-Rhodomonas_salina.2
MQRQENQRERLKLPLRALVLACLVFNCVGAFNLPLASQQVPTLGGFPDTLGRVRSLQSLAGRPRMQSGAVSSAASSAPPVLQCAGCTVSGWLSECPYQEVAERYNIDVSRARFETRGCKWPGPGSCR